MHKVNRPSENEPRPLVTVIVTVYRRVNYLREALASVLRQTLRDFEVIVSDDANLAGTEELTRASSDARVRYRANSQTLGTPLNVASALREARGEYVCILNDDDLMAPRMLESLVNALEVSQSSVMAFCDFEVIDANGIVIPGAFEKLPCWEMRRSGGSTAMSHSTEFALHRGVMAVMGTVFRRAACDPDWLMPELGGAYDYWLSIKLSRQGRFIYVPEHLFSYRQHEDSATARLFSTRFAPEIFIYRQLLSCEWAAPYRAFLRAELGKWMYWSGGEALRQEQLPPDTRSTLLAAYRLTGNRLALGGVLLTFLPSGLRRRAMILCNKQARFGQRRGDQLGSHSRNRDGA